MNLTRCFTSRSKLSAGTFVICEIFARARQILRLLRKFNCFTSSRDHIALNENGQVEIDFSDEGQLSLVYRKNVNESMCLSILYD